MHSEVKRLADQGDIAGLRYIFADALDVDPTFEQYQEDYDYCQSKGLLEPHQEFTPLTDEPSQWTKDYWAHLKVDLLKNLSARRLTHMKKVARVLMADKVQCLTAERQAAQAQRQADKAQEQAQAEQAARAAQPKPKEPTPNSPSPGSKAAAEWEEFQNKQKENEERNRQRDQSTERANRDTDRKNHAAREVSGSKKWAGIAMAAAVLVVILAIILVVLSNPGQAAAILQAGTKFISAITTPIV